MSPAHDPRVRASDDDREQVAALLRRGLADGRLTMAEFDERLDACFAARTLGDLDKLLADLPHPSPYEDLPVPASQIGGSSNQLPGQVRTSPMHYALGSYLSANVVCWTIWAVTGAAGTPPWPVWVTGPWGAVLLGRALAGGGWGGRDRRRRRH